MPYMIITQDTKEQNPLHFKNLKEVSEVKIQSLDFGDYGCTYNPSNKEKSQSPIFFERKSIPDLFSTLTSGHERFRKEIDRSKQINAKLFIAVEGTTEDVLSGADYSSVPGERILKTLDTIWFRYNIPTLFCHSREFMAWRMVNIWRTFYKEWGIKNGNDESRRSG